MDIALILTTNYPGAEWVLNSNDYSSLEWLDDSSKPTKAALEKQWPEVQYKAEKAAVNEQRRAAYQAESDPIFFQAQRGDTYTLEDWKTKVAEINIRIPYPVEK